MNLTIVGFFCLALVLNLAESLVIFKYGGRRQKPGTYGKLGENIYSETGCDGTMMSLSCDQGEQINIVRTVWGRYSLAICHQPLNDVLGSISQCADTVNSQKVVTAACQDKQSCQVSSREYLK